ncbi:LutC/YkgG family protein [Spirosoma pomorum]
MTSRDQILSRARQNKPDLQPLPEVPTFVREEDDLLDRFQKALAFVGGTLLELSADTSLSDLIRQTFPEAKRIASSLTLPEIDLTPINAETDKAVLEQIDLAVLAGEFAVAENAAIWLPEANMLHRALPFITQHLVLVVAKDQLVPNMHVAYQRIDRESLSYGVFIAGPSKTADIEQSLVVGAHGARSLLVMLT